MLVHLVSEVTEMGIIGLVLGLSIVEPQAALQEFEKRVDAYVALHRALEVHTPPRAAIHARDSMARVPNGLPVPLLWGLPELPAELEYRVIGRDLALWDEHAAMVIDFIPNAFPQQSFA